MTPAENKQTVDTLEEKLAIALTWVPTHHREAARAALRGLVVQADRAAELEAALRKIVDLYSDEGEEHLADSVFITARAALAGEGGGA